MIKNLTIFFYKKSQLNKREVRKIVGLILKDLSIDLTSLQINVLSDTQILELNKKHLGHDYNTDIITFNYSEHISEIDGEIFISLEDAEINAQRYKVRVKEELLRLIVHGILHLIGYDDMTSSAKRKMKTKENYLVKKLKNEIN